jgi:hypothetical protein
VNQLLKLLIIKDLNWHLTYLISKLNLLKIEYQSKAWLPLLSIQCSKDTQLFLCSLFAPVCVEQAAIYPCRSLCESVKQSCSNKMLSYGYQWPEMFNCSKFPDDNGLCIQSPTLSQPSPFTTVPLISTTPEAASIVPSKKTSTSKSASPTKKPSPQLVCHGCSDNSTISSMNNIVSSYCNSDIVIRGRLPLIKPSRFDLLRAKPLFKQNRTMSQYLSIPRRDRKVLKGAKLNLNSYLTEKSLLIQEQETPSGDYVDEAEDGELDIYLLSNYHLKLAHSLQRNTELKRLRSRSAQSYSQCRCDKLRKSMKQKVKYLLFGRVLRVKKANLKPLDSFAMLRRNRSVKNESIKHRRNGNGNRKQHQQQFIKVIYLNGVYSWHSAKDFIDYIEDDTINKENMCNDIDATVEEINRVKNLLI